MKTGIIVSSLILVFSSALVAQNVDRRVFRADGESMMLLHELSAILVSENDTVRVQHIPAKERLAEVYRDVNLKAGDAILMINRRRVKSASELESIYGEVKVGDEVKLGLERNGQFMLAAFKKGAPEELNKNRNVVMRREITDDGVMVEEEPIDLAGGARGMVITSSEDVSLLPGTNWLLIDRNGKVSVTDVLTGMPATPALEAKVGDQILSVNGKTVESLTSLTAAWDAIATGKEVVLKYLRDGKEDEVKFAKPEQRGTFIRRD
jgi:PDZ domain-containing secreted protein